MVKRSLRDMFPGVKGRRDKRALYALVSSGAASQLRSMVLDDPAMIGKRVSVWVPADDDVDMWIKGHFDRDVPENKRRLKDNQSAWIDQLVERGKIRKQFNRAFFTAGDS